MIVSCVQHCQFTVQSETLFEANSRTCRSEEMRLTSVSVAGNY